METLIWVSDYPLRGSSFGSVTLELTRRLRNYKIYILALGYKGTPIAPFPDLDILTLENVHQLDYYFRKLKPTKTVIFHSFYFLEKLVGVNLPDNTIGYIPIEGENLPSNLVNLLVNFDKIIVPSGYSQKVLKKAGLNSEVLYHGVDGSIFSPRSEKTVLQDFRWGYLGMNDIRKQIPRILEAYSRLPKSERGSLAIAAPNDGHYNLTAIARQFSVSPIWIERKFYDIPMSLPNIVEFYHSLGAYINCATEAFGLPNLEAASCGLPNIALDHGASREILKGAALYVKPIDFLDTNLGQVGLADRDDLYRKMKLLLEVPPERNRLAREGLKIAKEYTWEKAIARLEDILAK